MGLQRQEKRWYIGQQPETKSSNRPGDKPRVNRPSCSSSDSNLISFVRAFTAPLHGYRRVAYWSRRCFIVSNDDFRRRWSMPTHKTVVTGCIHNLGETRNCDFWAAYKHFVSCYVSSPWGNLRPEIRTYMRRGLHFFTVLEKITNYLRWIICRIQNQDIPQAKPCSRAHGGRRGGAQPAGWGDGPSVRRGNDCHLRFPSRRKQLFVFERLSASKNKRIPI